MQIFTDYANGKRMCDIVKELHDKGILTEENLSIQQQFT